MSSRLRKRKWGKVDEIDMRLRVGSEAWHRRHPHRIQKLSAYRYLHKLGNGHPPVRREARARGHGLSSQLTVRQMLGAANSLKRRK